VFSAATINLFFNNLDRIFKTLEHFIDLGAFLHTHDSQVIFFTVPDEEALVLGDIDTATVGPVTSNTRSHEVRVS